MIRPPPLLLGVGTVIWGFYCNQLVLSVMLAGLIEGLSALNIRLDLSDTDFRRILTFSAVGFIALAAYFLVRYSLREAFLGFLQWLPLIVLPMMVTQCNSSSRILDWRRLLPFLTSSGENAEQKPLSIDLA